MPNFVSIEDTLVAGVPVDIAIPRDIESLVLNNDDPTNDYTFVTASQEVTLGPGEELQLSGIGQNISAVLSGDGAFRLRMSSSPLACTIRPPAAGPVTTSAIEDGAVTEAKLQAADTEGTLGALRTATGVFDPSANAGERTIGDHAFGPSIPDNAIIMFAWYEVETTFASTVGPDDATIALGVNQAGATADIKAAVAINNGANPWDAAAEITCLPVWTFATAVDKLTAARQFNATVAVDNLDAGKLILHAVYFIGHN